MTTVHEKIIFNNKNIKVNNKGGDLTGDAGLIAINEFMLKLRLDKVIGKYLHIGDSRRSPKHKYLTIFKQMVFQTIAGYKYDVAANSLRQDKIFQTILGQDTLASQPTISRFIAKFNSQNIIELETIINKLANVLFKNTNQQEQIIDLDSTHFDTYGHQEKSNYNAHYQTNGYHPLIAFESLSGQLLGVKLRPGNKYTSNGAADFMRPIFNNLKQYSCDPNILVRGDSGFATPELYQLCDEQKSNFVIKLKANHLLSKLAEQHVVYGGITVSDTDTQYYELDYQPDTWNRRYRVVMKATKSTDELLFKSYEFLVTNLQELNIEDLFNIYNQRGVAENYIKEIKNGFFLDKTDSHSYNNNEVHMLINAIAYSIVQSFKQLALTSGEVSVATLRFKLLHIPARIIHHARNLYIQLSSTNVFDNLFWQTLYRVQKL